VEKAEFKSPFNRLSDLLRASKSIVMASNGGTGFKVFANMQYTSSPQV
jgi:hypothetical protein